MLGGIMNYLSYTGLLERMNSFGENIKTLSIIMTIIRHNHTSPPITHIKIANKDIPISLNRLI